MTILVRWLAEHAYIFYIACALGAAFYVWAALAARRERGLALFTLERETATSRAVRAWLMAGVFVAITGLIFVLTRYVVPRLPAEERGGETTPTPVAGVETPTPGATLTPTPTLGPPPPLITLTVAPPPPPPTEPPTPEGPPTPEPSPTPALAGSIGLALRNTVGGSGWVDLSAAAPHAGEVYQEGVYPYGEAFATIDGITYRFNRDAPDPAQYLPEPYAYRVTFDPALAAVTEETPGYRNDIGDWWAGPLGCASGRPEPYTITVELLHGDTVVTAVTFTFVVADVVGCGG